MQQRAAQVWKRILAFLLDLYIAAMALSSLLLVIRPETSASLADALTMQPTGTVLAALFYAGIFFFLYHAFSEYILGQTVGMLLFNISAEPTNQKQEDLGFWQAMCRNLFLIPIFPLTLLWLVEPLHYVFTGERLLERWTSTTTVEHAR